MHFGKSLKGHHPDAHEGSPSGSSHEINTNSAKDNESFQNQDERYEPLLGLAPSSCSEPPTRPTRWEEYASPPGPPDREEYASPLGPPPGRNEYAPPPGPPPSFQDPTFDPPPYHDWTSIPDTALLPPPPALGNELSPFSNANRTDADRAHDWCKLNPLVKPHQPSSAQVASVMNGTVRLLEPRQYNGGLYMVNTGVWKGSTGAGSKDASLISSAPLFFAVSDSPLNTGMAKTIYFEMKVHSFGRGRNTDESSIAIGFCGMPYPTWRMPGWERGSVAVHGDDGRRYVNDTWGGKDFTSLFRPGDTVGLGMSFSMLESPPAYGASALNTTSLKVEVFFTRNGTKDGSWDLHEELDADNDLGVVGLDGQYDLYGVLGTFGAVEFDVFFNSRDWLWRPK